MRLSQKPHSSAERMTKACEGLIGNCQLEVSLLNCPWKSCHPQSKFQLNDREIREVTMKADLNLKMPIERVRICEDNLRNTNNWLSLCTNVNG